LTLPQFPAVAARWQESVLEQGAIELAEIGADFVPPPSGWQRTDYQLVRRDRGSAFGERSQTWSFERGDARAVVSLDYPFLGWHELGECYAMQGWQFLSRRIDEQADRPPLVEIELRDARNNRSGLLLFALVDRTGTTVPPRRRGEVDELVERVTERLRSFVFRRQGSQASEGLTFQAQYFVEAYHTPTPEERAAARQTLRNALGKLNADWGRLAEPGRKDAP
jgi:hypothetical protein